MRAIILMLVSIGLGLASPSAGALQPGDIVVLEQGDAAHGVPAALVQIDPTTGAQTVLSSGGLLANGIGENPTGFASDPFAGRFLVTDRAGRLTAVDAASGRQSVLVAGLSTPTGVAVDAQGRVLIADYGGALLRFDPASGVSVVASGGLIGGVSPWAVQVHSSGDLIVSALTSGGNDVPGPPSRVIRIDAATGAQTLVAEISDGQFRDFALMDTSAFIAVSSRGYAASADAVMRLDLDSGQQTSVVTGLQRVLDVDFSPAGDLVILDQVLALPCCPPWIPAVYRTADGSSRSVLTQGGHLFVPGRLLVVPAGFASVTSTTRPAPTATTTTTMPPRTCGDSATCEDGDPCTVDACINGVCTNGQLGGLDGAACAVGQLSDVSRCGIASLPPGFAATVARRSARVQRLLLSAKTSPPPTLARLFSRVDRNLLAIENRADRLMRKAKLDRACDLAFHTAVDHRRNLVADLEAPRACGSHLRETSD